MITEQPTQNLQPSHRQQPAPGADMGIQVPEQLELPLEETPK